MIMIDGSQGSRVKRAASRESGQRDQDVKSEEVRRHESMYTRV